MGIAMTMREYLEDNYIPYEVMRHKKTACSSMTARAAHISGDDLAKGVVLRCDEQYVLVVLPASRRVDLEKVRELVGEDVELASESEAEMLFPDCESGAVPVFGMLYRIGTVVDHSLEKHKDVYFEGGDHRSLVHIHGDEFGRLMYGVPHGTFSR